MQVVPQFKRLPRHIGVIPDGNRRWASESGLSKDAGYARGIDPGLEAFDLCQALGIEELTVYGFTQDNTKRPSVQTRAFQKACVEVIEALTQRDSAILVVGNTDTPLFPEALCPFAEERQVFGKGTTRINFLINYGWQWDLRSALGKPSGTDITETLASRDISRIDLIIRWGGRRRLSGFLPVQSVYSDFYVVDFYWPEFHPDHLFEALAWYQEQDVTLGG